MKVERHAISNALKELTRVADPKAHPPLLAAIRLEAKNGHLNLAATDIDRYLSCQIPAEGELKATCLPAKPLYQLIKVERKTDAGFVELESLSENQTAVRVDGVSTKLTGCVPGDFPSAPGNTENLNWALAAVLPSEPLRESLSFVLPAASADSTRPNLLGVFFDGMRMVCTDGHRLHQAPLPVPLATPLLVPAGGMDVLMRLLGDRDQVFIATAEEHVRIRVGAWQLDTKRIDGTFPDVNHVIPDREQQPTRLMVDTAALSKALTHLGRLSKDHGIKFRVNGAITLSTWDADIGEAEVIVPALQSNHQGEDLITGFNPVFLRDALRGASKTVELGFAGPVDPLRIDLPGDRLAIVMPVRV